MQRPCSTAGVDEAGRGPLAGPVVVAAVILDPRRRINGLRRFEDADRRTARDARRAHPRSARSPSASSRSTSTTSTVSTSSRRRCSAWRARSPRCACVRRCALIDGNHVPQEHALRRTRDRRRRCARAGDQCRLDPGQGRARSPDVSNSTRRYPGYGFAQHKGYATPEHLAALDRLGPCREHRRSFAPVVQAELPLQLC